MGASIEVRFHTCEGYRSIREEMIRQNTDRMAAGKAEPSWDYFCGRALIPIPTTGVAAVAMDQVFGANGTARVCFGDLGSA